MELSWMRRMVDRMHRDRHVIQWTLALLAAMATSPAAFAGACEDQPGARVVALPVRVTTETLLPVEGLEGGEFRIERGESSAGDLRRQPRCPAGVYWHSA